MKKILYLSFVCICLFLTGCSSSDDGENLDSGGGNGNGSVTEANIVGDWAFDQIKENPSDVLHDYVHEGLECGLDHLSFSEGSTVNTGKEVYYSYNDECYEDVHNFEWSLSGNTLTIRQTPFKVVQYSASSLKLEEPSYGEFGGEILVLKKIQL